MKTPFRRIVLLMILLLSALLGSAQDVVSANEEASQIEDVSPSIWPTIIFDSIKTTDLLPHFSARPFLYEYQNGLPSFTKSSFEKNYEILEGNTKLNRRIVSKVSLEAPEVIDYCDLHEYDASIDDVKGGDREMRISGLEPMGIVVPPADNLKKYLKQREKSAWAFFGNLAVQFSQYYVTDNWYKGGTPNATFLTIFDYNIDYTKNRLLWENDFDVKIGFYNTSEDTIRAFRVNNDLVRISSLLAYQTWFSKKVYYSAGADFNTSLFTGYKTTNSNVVVTGFLSPSRLFLSLGMECRYNKKTTLRLAPFAYKLIFMTDDRIDHLTVGLDSTENHTSYLGYLVQAKLDWQFSKEINLTSRIDFFSSYDSQNIEFDWEVVGKFIINRFLSTRLSLIMRFDNTPKNEEAQIQVQEQLSFGFNYVFR